MTRTLSAGLTTEMNRIDRDPYGRVTVEYFLPEWTTRISGLSGGELEAYAHGHAAAVYPDGAGAGEDILFRARSGSFASPQDGKLYIFVRSGSFLDIPAAWDIFFIDSGITGLMYPAWTANSGAEHGGSIAVATWDNGGTPTGRVFYLKADGDLAFVDVNLLTRAVTGETVIASLGTGVQLASMQIAACKYDEVFVLVNQLVEGSLAAWHNDVYGSFIRRYYDSGGWQTDNTFFYHTRAEGGLVRDGADLGNDFGDTSASSTIDQWGKRPCGGLAACNIDDDTVLVALGLTHWRKWGYNAHSQALVGFIYHRDSGWWQPGPDGARADFVESRRLIVDGFARGMAIEGQNFLAWSRYTEPSDQVQTSGQEILPRLNEIVYAKLSPDGKYLTQFQHLSATPEELTAATLVVINHDGSKLLYAVGWRTVLESPPVALLCDVGSAAQDLGLYTTGYKLSWGNRMSMAGDIDIWDPSIITQASTQFKSGALTRFYYGTPDEQDQAGQGYVDLTSPTMQGGEDGLSEGASVNCRASKMLLDTRAETVEDTLRQNTLRVEPADPIKHISLHQGLWKVSPMTWPTTFFPGSFDALQGQNAHRLLSFPYAQTGGEGGVGDPGQVLNARNQYKGTWFKNVIWLDMLPLVNGSITASVRFGDVNNQGSFSFTADDGNDVYATLNRSNGVITTIDWRTGGFGGTIFNTVAQYALMAGVICYAVDIGKKYAFVWEHQSDFSVSSHTDDTWTVENFDRADYSGHGTGSNRLYLIVSDYDPANPDNWINLSVAGGIEATGLTPGQPADLKMVLQGGTLYAYYRAHSTGTKNQWRLGLVHKIGQVVAGRFGYVGRAHAGIQWDVLYPGREFIWKCDNYVDFWDIQLSDAVMDETLEENLARYCWRGFTATQFESAIDEASRTVNAAAYYDYGQTAANPVIDFKVSIPADTNEAGVFVRGVSSGAPTDDCLKIGLVAHSTANSAQNTVNYYVVKRRFASGSEVDAARDYAPIPVQLVPGLPVPVRVVVRDDLLTVWIAGNYAGHFYDDTSLGFRYGLYAEGGNADFTEIHVPELFEIPKKSLLEPGTSMWDAVQRIIGRRRIKGVYQYDGTLKFSYFETHDVGPDFEDTLWQSDYQRNSRFHSIVQVQGDGTFATYPALSLLTQGRRWHIETNKDITQQEFAYREAKAIATETAERQTEATFTGQPDLRVEPEDQVGIVVARQGIDDDFYIDDVTLRIEMGDQPDAAMTVSTRQKVIL